MNWKRSTLNDILAREESTVFYENTRKMIIFLFPKEYPVSTIRTLKMNSDMTMMRWKMDTLPSFKISIVYLYFVLYINLSAANVLMKYTAVRRGDEVAAPI